jgi:hypothetical protein
MSPVFPDSVYGRKVLISREILLILCGSSHLCFPRYGGVSAAALILSFVHASGCGGNGGAGGRSWRRNSYGAGG